MISIKRGAFYECPSLKKVIVHEDVKHINEEALGGCENQHTVILEGQTFLDLDCFTRRPRLTRISVHSGMSEYYKECQEDHWYYYIRI
ncbi:MAG: leucine-rich repeat protein [Bacteroidales bacterium]|nr:leucine-rich repeat protein [Bacteroidales bacterium]